MQGTLRLSGGATYFNTTPLGRAVTGTMLIDSLLLMVVMLLSWKWNRYITGAFGLLFILVDTAFFSANSLKVFHGGWFPLAIATVIFTLLTTWRTGRVLLANNLRAGAIPIEIFLQGLPDINRVAGTAIFLTSNPEGTPPALLHNLKHNQVLHERIIFLTVITAEIPRVPAAERVTIEQLADQGVQREVVMRRGSLFGHRRRCVVCNRFSLLHHARKGQLVELGLVA